MRIALPRSARLLWAQTRARLRADEDLLGEGDRYGAQLVDVPAAAPSAALELGFALDDPAAFDDRAGSDRGVPPRVTGLGEGRPPTSA